MKRHEFQIVAGAALLSVSYLALSIASGGGVRAEASAPGDVAQSSRSALPPVEITAPKQKPRPKAQLLTKKRVVNAVAHRSERPRSRPQIPAAIAGLPAMPSAWSPANTQAARTGTVGNYANSTAVATKTNTPLINIPQSVNVLTKDYIKDQNFQGLTDIGRYVPGVAVHQGEGNRDEIVIRGVDTSANFFVNGFRDDVQIFRDLYNTQSIEVLKGPSALTFGRGSGGGLINRTLKDADGQRIYDVAVQTGSYYDRRVTVDAGQAINETLAARLNLMYEGSHTFRDFGRLERFGINPTFTWAPDAATKVKVSYENFNDRRTADRGNPSQASSAVAPSSTRFNPTTPFAPGGNMSTLFGDPDLNVAHAKVQTTMGVIEHDFGGGLTVKNATLYANYLKFYQNVYPGNGALSGAVNPADTALNLAAYQHNTDRENLFNQTDFVYKGFTGHLHHTIAFGTEFGRQTGIDERNTAIFPTGTNTFVADPFAPAYFGPLTFIHQYPGAFSPGVTAADSNSRYALNVQSAYARDTIEIVPWLQLIGGARYDRFDFSTLDMNTITSQHRVDNLASPQGAVIVKPRENLSFYGAYSVSYLPASGDQLATLTNGTVVLKPQGFENKEIGVKWNVLPQLLYTAAVYDLVRTNVPLADPNNPGFFLLSGKNRIRGFETALNGYVTNNWQSTLGYAYTDARIASNTSATIVAGNRVQLVPFSQFSWWNKYQFNPMWAAAVGAVYFSNSYASSDDTVRLPGFLRFDAAVYLKVNETWRAQLNIENVLNRGYWASADGNNNISPGAPRTVRLTVTAKL